MKLQNSTALRAIWKQIHPPLTLEPRQAQKLQGLLSSSFRKQLDKEHPQGDSAKSPRLTESHIRRILSSPLLRPSPRNDAYDGATDEKNHVARLQSSLCSSLERFQRQVATGQATLDSAVELLLSYGTRPKNALRSLPAQDASDVVKAVNGWLWSSGLEESKEFAYDTTFIRLITFFLVRSSKDDVIWHWLDRLLMEKNASGSSWEVHSSQRAAAYLLRRFCYSKLFLERDPNDAIKTVLEAAQRFQQLTNINAMIQVVLTKIRDPLLLSSKRDSSLDEAVYQLLNKHLNAFQGTSERTRATYALFAPAPDPLPAWKYLMTWTPDKASGQTRLQAQKLVALGRRTSGLLSRLGEEARVDLLTEKLAALDLYSSHNKTRHPPSSNSVQESLDEDTAGYRFST